MKGKWFYGLALGLLLITSSALADVDKVVLEKANRKLTLLSKGKVVKEYLVALGPNPVGHKTQQGDGKTPEGKYVLDFKNPGSQFYKSIHISYPNAEDKAQAKRRGVSPGGDVFLHGLGKSAGYIGSAHRLRDWTLGCIAVTNEEIDEIWSLVKAGTPIEIKP